MPSVKIPIYQQQTAPNTQTMNVHAETPRMVDGLGEGLQALGAGIQKFSRDVQRIEDENTIARVRDKLFEDDLKWNQYLLDAKQNASDDPTGFFDQIGNDYAKYRDEALQSETSDIGRRIYSRGLNTLGHGLIKNAMEFEYTQTQKYRWNSIEKAIDNNAKLTVFDPSVERAQARYEQFSDLLELSGLTPEARQRADEKYRSVVGKTYLNSMLMSRPQEAQTLAAEIFGFVKNAKGQVKPDMGQPKQVTPDQGNPYAKDYADYKGSDQYSDIANKVSQKTGLPAEWIYGQWAHETGNFKNRGAQELNNLGGLRNKQGQYMKFDSLDEFADYFAAYIPRKYGKSGAMQAKTPEEYAAALKRGGYYEDSYNNYVAGLKRGMKQFASNTQASVQSDATAAAGPQEMTWQPPTDSYVITDDRINGNAPSVIPALDVSGRRMTEAEAINEAITSGKQFNAYASVDDAYIASGLKGAPVKLSTGNPILDWASGQDLLSFAHKVQMLKDSNRWVTDEPLKADLYSKIVLNPESITKNDILNKMGKGLTYQDAHAMIGELEKYTKPEKEKKDPVIVASDRAVVANINKLLTMKNPALGETDEERMQERTRLIQTFKKWREANPDADGSEFEARVLTPVKKGRLGQILDWVAGEGTASTWFYDKDIPGQRKAIERELGGGASQTIASNTPAYKEGQTATNPQTGERIIYRGGKWLKVQ
jgi:hypothetical protein